MRHSTLLMAVVALVLFLACGVNGEGLGDANDISGSSLFDGRPDNGLMSEPNSVDPNEGSSMDPNYMEVSNLDDVSERETFEIIFMDCYGNVRQRFVRLNTRTGEFEIFNYNHRTGLERELKHGPAKSSPGYFSIIVLEDGGTSGTGFMRMNTETGEFEMFHYGKDYGKDAGSMARILRDGPVWK